MEIESHKIIVSSEYAAMLPPISKEEYEALKESIKTEGQHYPIVVNSSYVVLDGHNRKKICEELGLEPKVEVKSFESPLKEKKFVLESNLLRRHLDVWHRIQAGKPLLEVYQEEAKERELKGDPRQKFGEGKAIEQFANAIHSNPETVRQALWIEENAPEKITELNKGEPISKVFKEVSSDKKKSELRQILEAGIQQPNGKYDVIVVDPPWPYGTNYDAEGRRCASPYPEMPIEQIKQIHLQMEDNCVVWLWTTNAFLHEAYHILEEWQLQPKTVLTWVKDKIGLGNWLRGQTEHCILAVKGSPRIWLSNQPTALMAKSVEHSRKPDEFYKMVEVLCAGKKLDYFARKKREGWDCYGTNELQDNL